MPTISVPNPLSSLADLLDPPEREPRWTPQPKQARAEQLATEADELLYGGAVYGGKSYWLVQHVIDELLAHPGNRGIILRRVFPSLNRTIIPKVREFVRGIGTYNETMHEVRFYNGSFLELATLQHEKDLENFQGPEYGVVAFEELTEFTETMWLGLIGRLRAPVDGVRAHAIATTNPGGTGHRWVKRRFVKPDPVDLEEGDPAPKPFEVWRPRATDENSTPDFPPLARAYCPATMNDNAIGMKRDPAYIVKVLANKNKAKRKAFRTGDWDAIDAVEGALWEQQWLDAFRVDAAPESRLRVVAIDPADGLEGGDKYGICVASAGLDGRFYVEQSHGWTKPINGLIDATVELGEQVGADRYVVERNHGGAWMMTAFKNRHPNVTMHTVWASDNKRTRAEPVSTLFEPVDDADLPRAVLVGHLPDLEDELTTFTGAPGEASPDQLDAMVWAITELKTHPVRKGARMTYAGRAR